MTSRTAMTVYRPREEVTRLWQSPEFRSGDIDDSRATVTFKEAPGSRGTEIHVDLGGDGGGVGLAKRLSLGTQLAKAKDELRRFKQLVETGEIARSDGAPEGERAERKLKQRPAQPLAAEELERVGAA
jgi:hypothetical protein